MATSDAADEQEGEVVARRTPDEQRAADWSLALASAGIAAGVERQGDLWQVVVEADDLARAAALLDEWDRDNPPRPPEPAPLPEPGSWLLGPLVALGLLAVTLLVGTRDAGSPWVARGAATASRILGGEPWLAVTALLLHANAAHLASNAVATLVLVGAAGKRLGSGLGALLVLLAGTLGNLANALVHGPPHSSVGFSTAVFGAAGLLGGLQFVARRRLGRRAAWTAIAAALGLFAVLGTGEKTDVLAHLLGLGAGLVLGTIAGLALRRPAGRAAQLAAALAALALTAAACWRAWR